MNELPENQTVSRQINEAVQGRTITKVCNATKLHKNTFWFGDPLTYEKLLTGKRIVSSESFGMYVDILMEEGTKISFGDGTNLRHGVITQKMPANYQLLLTLDNNTYLVFTVGMFGAIAAYNGIYDDPYYQKSANSISPLSDDFNNVYFDSLFTQNKPALPVKLFLAAEQRIPGLGNGVLQDILFNAGIHPKRQLNTLTDTEKSVLFQSIKRTLKTMTSLGGRDTETDLFGNKGGYKTILSRKTSGDLCPQCGSRIVKEAFMGGGAVYYCPDCQKIQP